MELLEVLPILFAFPLLILTILAISIVIRTGKKSSVKHKRSLEAMEAEIYLNEVDQHTHVETDSRYPDKMIYCPVIFALLILALISIGRPFSDLIFLTLVIGFFLGMHLFGYIVIPMRTLF